jgi:hypothetical protein
LLLTAPSIQAQDDKPTFPLETIYAKRIPWGIRPIFKNIWFSASLGAGNTFMKHKLDGYGIMQSSGRAPRIFPAGNTPSPLYQNWVNTVQAGQVPVTPDWYLVSADTARLGFKGNATNIPVHVSVHYQFKNIRIGAGYGLEAMSLRDFRPITFADKIGSFRPSDPNGLMKKYYVFAGYSFYRWQEILFTGQLQFGAFKPGNNFATGFIQTGGNINVSVVMERNLSEYFLMFIKPSFDFKSYTLDILGGGKSIKHTMNTLYLQVGVSYSIPELPRCFHPECKVQMNHAHGNREYRSRVHPFYKKQNPNYGENYPKLIKYKGKNKRKLNPY